MSNDILAREKADRPDNEGMIRGIENNNAYVYNINDIVEHLDIEKVKEHFNIEFFED